MNTDRLQSIDQFVITVTDLDRTVRWYLSSFRCELVSQTSGYAEIAFDNLRIGLSLPSQQPPHIAFEREDATSFGPSEIQPDGRRSTYLSDPSGNLVELLTPGAAS